MTDTNREAVPASDPFSSPATAVMERPSSPDETKRPNNQPQAAAVAKPEEILRRPAPTITTLKMILALVTELDDADLELLRSTVELESGERSPEYRGEQLFVEHRVIAEAEAASKHAAGDDGVRMIASAVSFHLQDTGRKVKQKRVKNDEAGPGLRVKSGDLTFKASFNGSVFHLQVKKAGAAALVFQTTADEAEEVVAAFARAAGRI